MRFFPAAGAALMLAACQPSIPDSAAHVGAGVGFGDYQSYMRDRERQAAAQRVPVVPAPQVVSLAPRPDAAPLTSIPIATMMAGPVVTPVAQVPQQVQAVQTPQAPPPDARTVVAQAPAPGGSALSEQDFQTLLARQQAPAPSGGSVSQPPRPTMFEPVAAQPLPERPADLPNIVAYALSTHNRLGEAVYRRSSVNLQNHSRNCGQFVSDDLAQEEFLRRGGPQRDPLNLDPDGDGFACWWNPDPFRSVVQSRN